MRTAKNANYLQKRFDKNANVLHIYIGLKNANQLQIKYLFNRSTGFALQIIYEV